MAEWLEGTLRKARFKWLQTIYVQRDKNTMEYEAWCFLNTKEAAGKAQGFLQVQLSLYPSVSSRQELVLETSCSQLLDDRLIKDIPV